MKRTAAQDGAAWITQCPIGSGTNHTYRFNVGEQTGTYWYHSHVTTQYCDGLRGPLVIYDDEDPLKQFYDLDDESTILSLSEWIYEPSPTAFQWAKEPQSMTVNGLGRTFFGDHILTRVDVVAGKRYRLRLINAGCLASFHFMIDRHPLTVIEMDGVAVKPHPVDSLWMHPGQRFSVVLNANQTTGTYWIRANLTWEGTYVNYDDSIATVHYLGSPDTRPTTSFKSGTRILKNEEGLTPWSKSEFSEQEADIKINLNITAWEDMYLVNGRPFETPKLPILLQIMRGADPNALLPQGSVIMLPKNKLIEISIPGGAPFGPHPMHLHGHSFEVVRGVNSTKYNYVNPPVRDVVSMGGAGDNVTIRFRTDNPGPWLLHCHIDFHFEGGLAIVFAEEPSDQRSLGEYPQEWKDLCTKWDHQKEGKRFSRLVWPGKEHSRFLYTPGTAPLDD
ncbi:hypothetical protein HGRIS_014085 [Hohenbuehelia grisea]|uniref:Laccase n=1 Tax=Hohenbuehelia grisea TaxID=104357 RepID=A0ABR3JU05_9AGAR